MKIGVLVVASIIAAAFVFWIGIGWVPPRTFLTAVVLALLVTHLLAHGMTSPLRAMTAAARAMAQGDYSRRVRATSRDEVGELARAFNQMASDLEAADRQRRELIANVSHELRTPTSALRAVLENLVDGVSQPDPRTLRAALAQTERLGALVADLLDLSRLDAGVAPLHREQFAVRPWLVAVAREAQVGRDARIEVSVSPEELTAVADPARLHQVVANLLDNAVRHGPPGEEITVRAWADGGGGLVLEVADQGPGIPVEARARVFERFIGADSGDARGGGTGLGLAIARWVVELHGGEIKVLDSPGCQIQVTVPAGTPDVHTRSES
ncbi:MAG: HAMP domain-containing protein [Micromonosporaceae bacterium]|nr:HAMP domain-containing protein [Micromonosporaceae bacterium]